MQVCNSLQTDNHASTTLLSFLQAACPSCRPTNSVKALKAQNTFLTNFMFQLKVEVIYILITLQKCILLFVAKVMKKVFELLFNKVICIL